MKLTKLLFLAATLTAPLSAFAAPGQVPEPGVLSLFGLGAAVAIAVAIRKGRR